MKKTTRFFVLLILFAGISITAYADTAIHLKISTGLGSVYDTDMSVAPCDNDNNPATGKTLATPYCAILQSGVPSTWDWTWAPGTFLTSLAGKSGFTSKDSSGNDVYHYWSWSVNGTDGALALNQYALQPSDNILLSFIDPADSTPESSPIQGTGGITAVPEVRTPQKKVFDFEKAVGFLVSQQKEDGSFGQDLYTDWAAISLSKIDGQKVQKENLKKYFEKNPLPANSSLTDYERRSMALMSLGINPHNKNQIDIIIKKLNEKISVNADSVNSKIFALIVLENSGYGKKEKVISDLKENILTNQEKNGSWANSVDLTGAGIEALAFLSDAPEVKKSIERAKDFLKQNQWNDGGFGNVSSTTWAIEGILSMGENPEDWKIRDTSPLEYLAKHQNADGGIEGKEAENRIWQTAYAISATSGKSWNQAMEKFEKPKQKTNSLSAQNIGDNTKSNEISNIEKQNLESGEKQNWFRKFLKLIFGF